MARDFIKISRSNSAPHHLLLLRYVSLLRDAFELGTQIKAIMDHNHDNTIFLDIEDLFGLPAGKGQTVYDLVNGSIGSMSGTFQTADAKNITEKLG